MGGLIRYVHSSEFSLLCSRSRSVPNFGTPWDWVSDAMSGPIVRFAWLSGGRTRTMATCAVRRSR